MKKDNYIKCPHCGAEYLPAEIFYPDYFLGRPSNIEKSATGIITYYDGKNMCLTEEYMCDRCNTTFIAKASVCFNSRKIEEKSFGDSYKTKLKKNDFTLDEE